MIKSIKNKVLFTNHVNSNDEIYQCCLLSSHAKFRYQAFCNPNSILKSLNGFLMAIVLAVFGSEYKRLQAQKALGLKSPPEDQLNKLEIGND